MRAPGPGLRALIVVCLAALASSLPAAGAEPADKLRAQAIIEWKNPDVKKAFEEGLKQQAAAAPAH